MQANIPYNPFLVTGYAGPEYFCDREIETEKIISALNNDRSINLMSPRRYGKTGLIHHVFHQLSEKKNICIYIDIYATQNLNDFVKKFSENVLGKVDGTLEKKIKQFSTFFKSFRPVISYDSLTGIPEISVKIESDNENKSLQEIFLYLQQSGKRCYIAIDEFQQIAEYPEKNTEALLRSYIQFSTNIKFIFSGSRQHLMREIFLSAKRPFYQSTQLMTLSIINSDLYYQFAQYHFKKEGYVINETCFNMIYSFCEGHTWYVQSLLNRLYEYKRNIDDEELVHRALFELLEENSYSYQELLNAYTTVQVNLLKAVAKEKVVTQIKSGWFVHKYKFNNVSSISRALDKLIDKELIYKTEKGYIVYDRFLGLWLSKL